MKKAQATNSHPIVLIFTVFYCTLESGFYVIKSKNVVHLFRYTAAAIITNEEGIPVPYLDKFVVSASRSVRNLTYFVGLKPFPVTVDGILLDE